ncbi:MAG: glycosyltransferase [Clostridia bacterium]
MWILKIWTILTGISIFLPSSYYIKEAGSSYFGSYSGTIFRLGPTAIFIMTLATISMVIYKRKFDIIYSIIPLYCVFMGSSRTYLLLGLCIFLVQWYCFLPNSKMFFMSIIPFAMLGLILVFSSSIGDKIIYTLNDSNYGSFVFRITSGRSNFWGLLIKDWLNEPFLNKLFGSGIEFSYQSINIWAHNDFLEILVSFGILGLCEYLYVMFLVFKKYLKTKNTIPFYIFITIGLVWFINAMLNMHYVYFCSLLSYPIFLCAVNEYFNYIPSDVLQNKSKSSGQSLDSLKILIVRTMPNKMSSDTYNLQEVGLAKALVRRGHQCDVMYYTDTKYDTIQEMLVDGNSKIKILWLHGFGAFYEGIYPSLNNYINDYDIIHISEYIGLTSCWLNRKCKGKTVNYQGPYFCKENKGDIIKAKIWDKILLPFSNKKDMVVATKSVLATDYTKSKGIDNVTTVGVGLDTEKLLNSPADIYEHEFIKKIYNKKDDEKYLLYIGAVEERRNILFLLDVFKKANEENSATKLVLVGKGKSEYVELCKQKITELNIEDKVFWCEKIEQKYLKAVYEISDIFLLPTRYEIFGMVLLEAMYFGLPTITTYNGGSATLMNEDNGFVIDNLDVNLWSKTIVDLLKNETRYKEISQNASKIISEEYTWDALAQKFEKIYLSRLNY